MSDTITVSSRITTRNFLDFAYFDTIIRQKRYQSPLFFFAAFLVFAITCFMMRSRAQQAILLAAVMLGIAIVFPGIYILNFYLSVRRKASELQLTDEGRLAYTLHMTDDTLTITNAIRKQQPLRLKWEQPVQAYRMKDCIYLYISSRQAFLLPDGCANVTPDELWAFLEQKMTAGKLTDRRRS